MESLLVYMYFLVLYVSSFLIQISYGHSSSICLPGKHAPLFIFGDSLYDNGNINYINTIFRANYPPYGETFFKYPTGRFCDGRIIPDFIGGAGALGEITPGKVIALKAQVNYFKMVNKILRKKLGNAEAKELLSKAVHIFNIGSNDYGSRFVTKSSVFLRYSQQEFVDIVIGNLTTVIKEIYELAGRKFGFNNVPPIGCSPVSRIRINGSQGACQEELLAAARLHNKALPRMLQKLERQLKRFKYSLTDLYSTVEQVMKYPSKYGFKEGNVACCGGGRYRGDSSCGGKRGIKKYELCKNPSEYLFFDSAHPTDRANQHFAQLIWSGNRSVTKPYNLKELFEV